jgi:predicted GTPase
VVFLAGKAPLHFSTERYLQNQLREKFAFYATPIRIQQRLKKSRSSKK